MSRSDSRKKVVGSGSDAPPMSSHLLEPTKANVHGTYRKPAVEVDPREMQWNSHTPMKSKSPPRIVPEERVVSPGRSSSKSPRKVKEASSRLLEPTKANENGKYRAPEAYSPTYKIAAKPTVSSHLLTSTKAAENGKYRGPEEFPVFKAPPAVKAVAGHLLTPTKASERNAYKKPAVVDTVDPRELGWQHVTAKKSDKALEEEPTIPIEA